MIAGLMRPESGRISTDDRCWSTPRRASFLPPHKRRIGYVFQDARLFPHLTVRQNLVYGRRFAPQAERYGDFDEVGRAPRHRPSARLAGRPGFPAARSSASRSAARCIASPRLILMDEPLASLDDARKAEILPFIERLRDEARVPIVYVSHSVAEVARLATDIVVLDRGRVSAAGPARDILAGLDLLPAIGRRRGRLAPGLEFRRFDAANRPLPLPLASGQVAPAASTHRPGDKVPVFVECVRHPSRHSAARRHQRTQRLFGPRHRDCGRRTRMSFWSISTAMAIFLTARITRHSAGRLGLAEGMAVQAIVKTVRLKES